jgi:hypothetical protein
MQQSFNIEQGTILGGGLETTDCLLILCAAATTDE